MNHIIKACVHITYETRSGFESSEKLTGINSSKPLVDAIAELGRILTINGQAAEATRVLREAIKRTQLDLETEDSSDA